MIIEIVSAFIVVSATIVLLSVGFHEGWKKGFNDGKESLKKAGWKDCDTCHYHYEWV